MLGSFEYKNVYLIKSFFKKYVFFNCTIYKNIKTNYSLNFIFNPKSKDAFNLCQSRIAQRNIFYINCVCYIFFVSIQITVRRDFNILYLWFPTVWCATESGILFSFTFFHQYWNTYYSNNCFVIQRIISPTQII